MLPAQQKTVPLSSGEHSQQEYGIDFRPFLPVPQGPGSNSGLQNPRNQSDPPGGLTASSVIVTATFLPF